LLNIVAVFGHKVECCFDIVADVDRALVAYNTQQKGFQLMQWKSLAAIYEATW